MGREYNAAYYQKNKDQIKARQLEWQKKNKHKRKRINKNFSLKRLYGISIDDYEAILASQKGVCAVCYRGPDTCVQGSLSVDHDHTTGAIRGLLCDRCNRALGLLGDDIDRIQRLAFYVARAK